MRYRITSKFNAVEDIRDHVHKGVDYALSKNTPLYTMQEGVVTKVTDYKGVNIGKGVIIKWSDGKEAIYGHLNSVSVKAGDVLHKGSLIGYSGNTGSVAGKNGGYHLHFAVKDNGQFIDPMPYNHLIQTMQQMDAPIRSTDVETADLLRQGMSLFQEQLSNMLVNYAMLIKNFHNFL
ncbi:M23 family metallopeptidase [Halobacillus litoralis]|uniref:M23 family metallopeptidase n=1 Tax=Halobacillus litoralis TaxID=45668 RepID=UPI001CD3FDD9|nr:M23 family metallopeptidase [Halobacillus litoralis]MCA1021622.1 M23 family metallopeptidase [Halobacillus litoralis]